jgi:hypothetical protein
MAERRALIEGVKPATDVAASMEKQFVFGSKANSAPQTPTPPVEAREEKGQAGKPVSRVPFTTRVRADYASALKRASLERELNGVFPHTLQDLLEDALEPWLRSNGYLA